MTEDLIKAYYKTLGKNIKQARQNKKLKQFALASSLNLSRYSIANIESGRQRPGIHLLVEISKLTDVDLNKLLPNFDSPLKISETLLKQIDRSIKQKKNEVNITDTKKRLNKILIDFNTIINNEVSRD